MGWFRPDVTRSLGFESYIFKKNPDPSPNLQDRGKFFHVYEMCDTLGCQIDKYTRLFGTKETWRKKQTQRQTKVFNKNPPYSFIWPYSFNWHLRVVRVDFFSNDESVWRIFFYDFCYEFLLENFYWPIIFKRLNRIGVVSKNLPKHLCFIYVKSILKENL